MPGGKGVAGAGIEVSFERVRLCVVSKTKNSNRFPGTMLRRVGGPARVVLFEAFLEVAGTADVPFGSIRSACEKLDVFHRGLPCFALCCAPGYGESGELAFV